MRTRLSVKEIQKKIAKKSLFFLSLWTCRSQLTLSVFYRTILQSIPLYLISQNSSTIRRKPLNILIQSQPHRENWLDFVHGINTKYTLSISTWRKKKTREKTHHKVIELFGLVSIFDCSDNRCSNFSLSQVICSDFFFPSYYKQTSKNGGGDGRLQICTTGE